MQKPVIGPDGNPVLKPDGTPQTEEVKVDATVVGGEMCIRDRISGPSGPLEWHGSAVNDPGQYYSMR